MIKFPTKIYWKTAAVIMATAVIGFGGRIAETFTKQVQTAAVIEGYKNGNNMVSAYTNNIPHFIAIGLYTFAAFVFLLGMVNVINDIIKIINDYKKRKNESKEI